MLHRTQYSTQEDYHSVREQTLAINNEYTTGLGGVGRRMMDGNEMNVFQPKGNNKQTNSSIYISLLIRCNNYTLKVLFRKHEHLLQLRLILVSRLHRQEAQDKPLNNLYKLELKKKLKLNIITFKLFNSQKVIDQRCFMYFITNC